jgi:thiol-disulfide isomerase/thioredoxin
MQNFITTLKAENIKKRGTGIFLLSVILGAISSIIWALVVIFQDPQKGDGGLPYNYFSKFIESALDPFAGFFFPLLIIITVSRFAQLDHKNGGWQLMETQPVSKMSIYFSKFTLILAANLISILSLIAFGYLCGGIASLVKDVPKEAIFSFEAGFVFKTVLRLFLAGLMLSALQYLIAVLLPSFIWAIVIGFFGLLLNLFLLALNVVPRWSPYAVLSHISRYKQGSDLGYWITYSEIISILGSIILLYIGFKWYRHKNFKWAFFKPSRALKLLGVLVVCISLLVYVLQPNKMLNYSETVISGQVEGADYKTLYVIDNFVKDTVAVIPIKNKRFNYTIKSPIVLNSYMLMFDQKEQQFATFGNKDSLFLDLKTSKTESELKVTGTRLAENQYVGEKGSSWSMITYYLEDNLFIDEPEVFTNHLIREWRNATSESDKFSTADNYVPKDDFLEKNKIMLTIQYLNFWNEYLKKRNAMHPGEATKETADVKEMKRTVPLNDESLLNESSYFNYLTSTLIAKTPGDIDDNTKSIKAIAKLPAGTFKDKMLYWQLNKSIKEASTEKERAELLIGYSSSFKNSKYTKLLANYNKVINSLSKGMPAQQFDAISIDQKPYTLADFKGKFVIIDVWATWCGPCKKQSPYFERFARKYKDNPVQFVALSTDERIDKWFIEAKTKSKTVLQLHINDTDKFGKEYNVETIPRFILIDPDGNFVNSTLPFPEDPQFEKLLREALGLAEEK